MAETHSKAEKTEKIRRSKPRAEKEPKSEVAKEDKTEKTRKSMKEVDPKRIEKPKHTREQTKEAKPTETMRENIPKSGPEPVAKPERKDLLSIIKYLKEKSKPRKFIQTWDLSVNLKGIDLRKPENRFNAQLTLPGGRGKEIRVAVIADSLVAEAEKCANLVIKKADIQDLAKNKKKLKKIAGEYDWFFGEVTLMAEIGKRLGTVLGPRGKMPRPIPPKAKVEPFVMGAKNSVRISVKENPVVHVVVGSEKLEDKEVANNVQAVYNMIKERLPKGVNNIRSVFLKLTMSKPIKLHMK